jgi:hypothetical protein
MRVKEGMNWSRIQGDVRWMNAKRELTRERRTFPESARVKEVYERRKQGLKDVLRG